MRLYPWLSYRPFGSSVIVVDHRRDELFELDGEVTTLLGKLERGARIRTPADRARLEALADIGLVERRPRSSAGAPAAPRTGSLPASPAAGSGHPDLLDALNRRAAAALVPLHAQIELTRRCRLDCDYCYLAPRRAAAEPELGRAEIVRVLDELVRLGTLFVLLTGGEPLLRRDLVELVEHARARRFAVSLLTSGFGLTRERARRLAARGLDCVQVSVHAAEPARHDARTGVAGSFAQAIDALRIWQSLGVRTQMAVTVTRLNQHELPALAALAKALDVTVNFSCTVLPRLDGSTAPLGLRADDDGLRAAFETFPSAVPGRLAGRRPDEPPCGAGAATIAIDAFGVVYPCHALHVPVGSIRRESLADIWQGSVDLARIRAVRLRDLRDCPDCAQRDHCNRCAGVAVDEGLAVTDHSSQDCAQARARASLVTPPATGAAPATDHTRRRTPPSRDSRAPARRCDGRAHRSRATTGRRV